MQYWKLKTISHQDLNSAKLANNNKLSRTFFLLVFCTLHHPKPHMQRIILYIIEPLYMQWLNFFPPQQFPISYRVCNIARDAQAAAAFQSFSPWLRIPMGADEDDSL